MEEEQTKKNTNNEKKKKRRKDSSNCNNNNNINKYNREGKYYKRRATQFLTDRRGSAVMVDHEQKSDYSQSWINIGYARRMPHTCVAECTWNGGYMCHWGTFFSWGCDLCGFDQFTLYLFACRARVIVGDSSMLLCSFLDRNWIEHAKLDRCYHHTDFQGPCLNRIRDHANIIRLLLRQETQPVLFRWTIR